MANNSSAFNILGDVELFCSTFQTARVAARESTKLLDFFIGYYKRICYLNL